MRLHGREWRGVSSLMVVSATATLTAAWVEGGGKEGRERAGVAVGGMQVVVAQHRLWQRLLPWRA